ncbi:MAG: ATP-binding protein [Microbacterium sp.]|nr:MAG: ATP-binding protein [Microbacterium sp.]
MRTANNNPFSPGSDVIPEVWAGRVEQLSDWRDVLRPRLLIGKPERGRTILGEPGLGKSSLVQKIADSARDSGDWVTPQLRIPSGTDPLKRVATAVLDLAAQAGLPARREKTIATALARVEAVAVSGIGLTLRAQDGPEPYTALTELLIEIGKAALSQGHVVLVHIDEVQNITDEAVLSQLLVALGDALTTTTTVTVLGGEKVSRGLPIGVYLTGLPDFAEAAAALKGATFARRFKTTTLSGIADDDLEAALQQFVLHGWEVADGNGGIARIRMNPEAAEAIVSLCVGEPFLFQLAGERAWYAGTGPTITAEEVYRGWLGAEQEAASHVERVIDRLPERERAFLAAMASLPPDERTLSRIAEEAGFAKVTAAGTTSARLDTKRGIISRGRPYAFRHRAIGAYLTTDWPSPPR